MNSGFLAFGIIFIYLLICVAFGLIRGLAKTRMRVITIAISAILAVVATLILKANLFTPEFVAETLIPTLGVEGLAEIFAVSPSMGEVMAGLVGGLLTPVICLALFIALSVVTWIVYFILALVFRKRMKEHNKRSRLSLLRAAALSLLHGLIVIFIVMIPVVTYFNVFNSFGKAIADTELAQTEEMAPVLEVTNATQEIYDSAAVVAFRFIGVDALSNSMTSFTLRGEEVVLNNELDAVAGFLFDVVRLSESEMAAYGEKEAQIFASIANSFDQSILLPTIIGECMGAATDAWLDHQAFLGMEAPTFGDDELFVPFTNELLLILNEDSKTTAQLKADVLTLSELVSAFARSNVFASIDDPDGLMRSLSQDGTIRSTVSILGKNQSMKRLVPQITNLGIRAIGQTLGLPDNSEVVYDDFMDDVVLALNDVRSADDATRVSLMSESLNASFQDAGVEVDSEILDFYASSMVHDLIDSNPNDTVTTDDVQAFFALYADHLVEESGNDLQFNQLPTNVTNTVALSGEKNPLEGSVYERMSEEERQNSAAARLAAFCQALSSMSESDHFSDDARVLASQSFAPIFGNKNGVMEHLNSKAPNGPIDMDSNRNTAGMRSSGEMNTMLVTLDQLLVNAAEAAALLDEVAIAKEADAIDAIFSTATELLDVKSEEMNLTTLANNVGVILDSLKTTESYGAEKTADLFTAVFQSKSVREAADMDIATATQMAQKATEGEVAYTETLVSISKGVDAVSALQFENGVPSDEELRDLIGNITPQSAAMMEVYITPDRMIGFGTPAEQADVTSALLVSTFSYMGREDLEDYDAEAKALNRVLNVALAAKNDDGRPLFSDEGQNNGRLSTEKDTIETMMASAAVTYAVRDVLTDGEKVTCDDPLALRSKIGDEGSEGAQRFEMALNEYYAEHPETDQLTLQAMAALFGMEMTF